MVRVTVPATSANMGSGYDSIGIALEMYNVIDLAENDHIDISDKNGQFVPKDESNLIYQCAKRVYDECGKPLSGLTIVEDCAIPQTRGLGSSSACTVAGIMGANALLGEPLDRNAVIDLAATIEGPPDNSTPAILGGFCVALLENGHVSHVRVPVHGAIDFVVFIPDFQLSTEKARAALPKTIDHHDAVYNLARAALLAGSLTTGKLENLDVATGDCLHQPYRFSLIENGEDIVREAKELGALGAFISELIPDDVKHRFHIRWETILVAVEIVFVAVLGALPASTPVQVFQVSINFIASMQYNTFRNSEGVPMATTFATNHVRQLGIGLAKELHRRHGDTSHRRVLKRHFSMVLFFLAGTILGAVACIFLGRRAVWVAALPYAIVFVAFLHADLTSEKEWLERDPAGH